MGFLSNKIWVRIFLGHPVYAMDGRGAIEICLSEKGALAKNRLGNTEINQ